MPTADDVSLREYVDVRFSELDKRWVQHTDALRAALEKADSNNERRLALLNEFRGQAADEAKKYLPRAEYEAKHAALIKTGDDRYEAMIKAGETRSKVVDAQIRGFGMWQARMAGALALISVSLPVLLLIFRH